MAWGGAGGGLAVELVLLLFVESSILVGAGLLATRLSRRRSSAWRAAVWSGVTVALLVLPAFEGVAPAWSLPGLEGWRVEPGSAVVDAGGPRAIPTGDGAPAGGRISPAEAPPVRPSLAALVFGVWLAGLAVGGVRLLLDRLRLARRVAAGHRPGAELGRLLRRSGVDLTRVRVRMVPALEAPAVAGVLRPVLLLPETSAVWPPERWKAVLAHELAHVRRHDVVFHELGLWVATLYWPNPLVRLAMERARTERERACDDEALATGLAPDRYATILLELAERTREAAGAGAVALARRSTLSRRLLSILDGAQDRQSVRPPVAGALLAGFVFVAVAAAGVQGEGRAMAEDPLRGALPVERGPETPPADFPRAASMRTSWTPSEVALSALAREGSPGVRNSALAALALRPTLSPQTASELGGLVRKEPVPAVRALALQALGWRGLATVPGALTWASQDRSATVRRAALTLIAQAPRGGLAHQALLCLSEDREPDIRDAARALLGRT